MSSLPALISLPLSLLSSYRWESSQSSALRRHSSHHAARDADVWEPSQCVHTEAVPARLHSFHIASLTLCSIAMVHRLHKRWCVDGYAC